MAKDAHLTCANGELWLGPHPMCQAETARICGVPVSEVLLPDYSKYGALGSPGMRFAYADPPYVGQSRKHYGGSEVNHRLLIAHLCDEFPDGWALSCSSPSLRQLLPMCPKDVRVGPWVKPFAVFKPNVNPAYDWEPVIFRGGRKRANRKEATVRDWVSANITLRRGLTGAKPSTFCFWVFEFLNARPHDELVEIFPGTGAVTDAWVSFKESAQVSLIGGNNHEPTDSPVDAPRPGWLF